MNNNPYKPTSTAQGYLQHSVPVTPQLTSRQRQPSFAGMPNWQGRDIRHAAHLAQLLQSPYFPGQQGRSLMPHFNPNLTGIDRATIAAVQPHMRLTRKPAHAHTPGLHTPAHHNSSAISHANIPPRTTEHNPEQAKRSSSQSFYQKSISNNPRPSQQDTEYTSHTSPTNSVSESTEGSETSTIKDGELLDDAFVSSSVDSHTSLQTGAQRQTLTADLLPTSLSHENDMGMFPSNNPLLAAAFHLLSPQNQHYKQPLLPTPEPIYQQPYGWMPFQNMRSSEVIQFLNQYHNQRVCGEIIFVTDYKSGGLGYAHLYPLDIKFRIKFPEAFRALTKEQIMNMGVEGYLLFNQRKLGQYVKQHSEGAFYNSSLQKAKHARDIPICLHATALIDDFNRRITPESQHILTHIQSLFEQSVTADIIVFFDKHQGGIARHCDETTGISTRFLFRLPNQLLKNVPIKELTNKYTKLQAQINPVDDEALKSYVLGVGSKTFIRDLAINRIILRSREVTLLPADEG
ncbi:hypothetical protein [Endozoicomonas sp. SESOKO1]|uniref:hypothetical protein n=1 Tax=Endozoicomonas sp. SESOKO1 TaxID=2828742 RepID=UPI0021483DE6|nr:hypothetical protein [Endozoicomonas sp. SESOKO1]